MFLATKGSLEICVMTGEWSPGFTLGTEDDEVKLAKGPTLGALCGWYNV